MVGDVFYLHFEIIITVDEVGVDEMGVDEIFALITVRFSPKIYVLGRLLESARL